MELRGTGLKPKPGKNPASVRAKRPLAVVKLTEKPLQNKSLKKASGSNSSGEVKRHNAPKLEPIDKIKHATTLKGVIEKPALSVEEEAQVLLGMPPDNVLGPTGAVKVRFNHYNKEFGVHNGVLRWSLIDEEYCLSFVYKGNYRRDLHIVPLPATADIDDSTSKQKFFEAPASKLDWPKALRDELGLYFIKIDVNRYIIIFFP